MEQLALLAANTFYRTAYAPEESGFGLRDLVTAAYPPLQQHFFYALQWSGRALPQNGRRPRHGARDLCSCAESALMLALARVWKDREEQQGAEKAGPMPCIEVTVAQYGATVNQMVRILQRLHIAHFPLIMYRVESDSFELQHGKLRSDANAIVFIPSDVAGGMQWPHWTFGCIPIEQLRVEQPLVSSDRRAVVYTRYNITDPLVYWRAEVCPENLVCYEAARARGLACDCDWNGICEHEMNYCGMSYEGLDIAELGYHLTAKAVWNAWSGDTQGVCVRDVLRLTLDGERHVIGTARALLTKATHGGFPVRRTGDSGMSQRTPTGTIVERQGMDPTSAILAHRPWYDLDKYTCNNPYVHSTLHVQDFYVQPMVMSVWLLERQELMQDWKARNLPSFTVPRIAYTIKGYMKNRVAQVELQAAKRAWAADEDLCLRLPRKEELLNRLALRQELTADSVLDVVRRMCAEEKWDVDVDAAEFKIWLSRVVTQTGKTAQIPAPQAGQCWHCLRSVKTFRHMCKTCRRMLSASPMEMLPVWDETVVYVGFRPLWSKNFRLPQFVLKSDVSVSLAKSKRLLFEGKTVCTRSALDSVLQMFYRSVAELSCRGYLRGPMFLGQEPTCFPRGEGTAMLAFLVRLGARREHEAQEWVYEVAYQFLRPNLQQIDPESWDEFIAHFSGVKRLKNIEGHREELEGWLPQKDGGAVRVRMSGFPKAEKSYNFSMQPDRFMTLKETEKPRFICSPDPVVLAKLGRWTHAQTKWLSRQFTHDDHLFYAGCSTPEQLNQWLNMTLDATVEPITLVDDITAIDANHSQQSFEFHARVRQIQFPYCDSWIELAYRGEETLVIRVGRYVAKVKDVNASGVSDTSYKNSLICLVIRALALLHALFDVSGWSSEDIVAGAQEMLRFVWITASGDDGLIRLPGVVMGCDVLSLSLERYREFWSWAGFGVKAVMLPPNKWRMATYLAMRPVWAGSRYEWAPEPARRLRGLFWQIDNGVHHEAWARGVATQVLQQAKALPVLSDVCQWFLDNTRGPVAREPVGNEYSPFYGSVMSGGINERSVREFCLDYHVKLADYDRFKDLLASTKAVQVNFSCHILDRIFQEES